MPCHGDLPDPDAGAAKRLELERSLVARFTTLYNILREDITATITDGHLNTIRIARGTPLDVDNIGSIPHADASSQFFSPCDWTLASLDYESGGFSDCCWVDLTRRDTKLCLPLGVTMIISDWFQARLLTLQSIEENVWQPAVPESSLGRMRWDCSREAIKEKLGLELPRYEFGSDTNHPPQYEYRGTWAYFAEAAADQPHAVCTVLDSASPTEQLAVRSEVLAAVKMSEFQHQLACFTQHYIKPILVCTYFRNQTTRITQAHFDTKIDRLVLRQSRILDLRGAEAPPDAWLMLRWMASAPVGPTRYMSPAASPEDSGRDSASRPPRITVSN
ncbi:hypothetical protein NLG97_g4421 [Lecanicillium saksenae]|uniref:Uncharacterized protein n=1 Tax=Lecanicillium saksenae TaxID=468837 RepID=A0ACC1QVX0_9HYPO|nr:hypothetical protein NLG97_g4421 [Lecanicillium saksenae]